MTPWTAAFKAPLSSTVSRHLLKFVSIESVMPSNHLIFFRPFLLLPSTYPSIRIFSSESALPIRWPKSWNFSNCPPNEYSGLISFRIGLFDLLAVQGTLKSFLQHHNSKVSILGCSAFFMDQLSLLEKPVVFVYMDLCQQSDVSAFLPRSKCLNFKGAISYLQ